ncbi:MAG TPA: bifunctional pyr operon transcriptional regulator/uracil phosphoribosyltransferase PyrR [Alcanivoracaceae bacterium]|nr:bifunctional pyr operon transcriptional regulator/uracil phosphoribosyltransferase PyrR [Alcanivoracaceae bacterium]
MTHFDTPYISQLLDKMTTQLQEYLASHNIEEFHLIGIHSGGVWVAEALKERLQHTAPLGALNISFYRDDFSQRGLHPRVKPSNLPFDIENAHVVLVDDVLMSGRTVRAALNEIFDYGRPASITLATLFDIGRRELPISPDVCGEPLSLTLPLRVKVNGPTPLTADIIDPNKANHD